MPYKRTLAEASEAFGESLGDPDTAFEQVAAWSAEVPPEYGPGRRQDQLVGDVAGKTGPKRKPVLKVVKPLPGRQTLSTDELIRAITALESQGFPRRKIEDTLGLSRKRSQELMIQQPQAFDAAQADGIKYAMTKYNSTMAYVVGFLSEKAPIAMETFVELMEDKDVSSTVRLKAASKFMDMLMAKGSADNSHAKTIEAVGNLVMDLKKQESAYIVDGVIEAEIEEEGAENARD